MAAAPERPRAVVAVFDTVGAAEAAKGFLAAARVAPLRMTLSVPRADDGIVAEYPGQSYENQPGQSMGSFADDRRSTGTPRPAVLASSRTKGIDASR